MQNELLSNLLALLITIISVGLVYNFITKSYIGKFLLSCIVLLWVVMKTSYQLAIFSYGSASKFIAKKRLDLDAKNSCDANKSITAKKGNKLNVFSFLNYRQNQ